MQRRRYMEAFFENYFFGMITCSEEYYENITESNEKGNHYRQYRGMHFDPFEEQSKEEALTIGVPTIVYEKDGLFYDLLYSIYDNELSYTYQVENTLGISLVHIEPMLDWIEIETIVGHLSMQSILLYTKQFSSLNLLPYYLDWNSKRKRYDISIQNKEIFDEFYQNYLCEFFPKPSLEGSDLLNSYYVGIITVNENMYASPNVQNRWLQTEGEIANYNPFAELSKEAASTQGVPTLLYKKGNVYIDIYHERYPNELQYRLHQENTMGIYLEEVRPFTEVYSMLPIPPFASFDDLLEKVDGFPLFPYLLYKNDNYEYPLIHLFDEDPLSDYHYAWYHQKQKQLTSKRTSEIEKDNL